MFNRKYLVAVGIVIMNLTACGQSNSSQINENEELSNSSKQQNTMDLSKIEDSTIKAAIEALQAGNQSWYSFFIEKPVMTDDGNEIDFHGFFKNALGDEKFLSIEKIEDNGNTIVGNFKAGKWGTFVVFFTFHKNQEGKFTQLDIGQVSKR